MTDRLNAITVVLDRDIRDDDAKPLMDAIGMMKGVQSVVPNVVDQASIVAEQRARHDMREKLIAVLQSML